MSSSKPQTTSPSDQTFAAESRRPDEEETDIERLPPPSADEFSDQKISNVKKAIAQAKSKIDSSKEIEKKAEIAMSKEKEKKESVKLPTPVAPHKPIESLKRSWADEVHETILEEEEEEDDYDSDDDEDDEPEDPKPPVVASKSLVPPAISVEKKTDVSLPKGTTSGPPSPLEQFEQVSRSSLTMIANLDAIKADSTAKLMNLHHRCQELETTVAIQKTSLDAFEKTTLSLRQTVAALQSQISQMELTHTQQMSDLETRLNDRITSTFSEHSELPEIYTKLSQQLKTLKDSLPKESLAQLKEVELTPRQQVITENVRKRTDSSSAARRSRFAKMRN